MVVAVPLLWMLMPWLMRLVYGADFRAHATDAARLVLLAAALQLIWGWTKSFPVSIGRPGLRDRRARGRDRRASCRSCSCSARGGARPAPPAACSSRRSSSALLWTSCCSRGCAASVARDRRVLAQLKVLVVSGIWPPDVGGPASHAPEVAAFLRGARPRGRGGDHGRRRARAGGVPGALGAALAAAGRAARRRACGSIAARARRGRRRLHDRDVRPLRARRRCSARTPFVIKLTADPAYERARRWGLGDGLARGLPARSAPRATLPLRARARRRRAPRGARRHAVGVPARARARLGRPAERVTRAAEPGAAAAGARAARRAARASSASTGRRSPSPAG